MVAPVFDRVALITRPKPQVPQFPGLVNTGMMVIFTLPFLRSRALTALLSHVILNDDDEVMLNVLRCQLTY